MSKKAMPKSKAKTAYGLLSDIRALILKEPRSYDQRFFRIEPHEFNDFYPHYEERPKCGSTFCVAGHVCAQRAVRWDYDSARSKAASILGLDFLEADELFAGGAAGERSGNVLAHAKNGAAHIARFQKKYAKQLKAKRV